MARGKKLTEVEILNKQIEAAEAEIAKAKQKLDDATENLKALAEKKKTMQAEELLNAITNSGRSFDEVLDYIQSDSTGK